MLVLSVWTHCTCVIFWMKSWMFALRSLSLSLPLSSGPTWYCWIERWKWRPWSTGEPEVSVLIRHKKCLSPAAERYVPLCPYIKWSSCVCTGSPWHPGSYRTTWQSWQEGEWTHSPSVLTHHCVCVHNLCVRCCVVVCTCGQSSNTERLSGTSTSTNNCLICA